MSTLVASGLFCDPIGSSDCTCTDAYDTSTCTCDSGFTNKVDDKTNCIGWRSFLITIPLLYLLSQWSFSKVPY